MDHFDVLIVGAGLSGIGTAYHLKHRCPRKSYAILEGRERIGGTWDLFRYPGVRSDSDMYTLGYSFRPWREAKAIADGPSILKYVIDTAGENGIDRHIRFGHKVVSADWSSEHAHWLVTAEAGGGGATFTCNFLMMCSGYYRYEAGFTPDFAGTEDFSGRIVHPQSWPPDLDYTGKKVVVIGSGATAVTLVPAMTDKATHVTMLQRSPTYVVSRPAVDGVADWLREILPAKLAYGLVRWKNVLLGMLFFRLSRRRPAKVKDRLIGMVRAHLGPDYDVAAHFTPRYNPWDQRLCLVPDADLFEAINAGRASVVTDTIENFIPSGLKLASGKTLDADIVVTATGLHLQMFGGMILSIDGERVQQSQATSYKGMMLSQVPNLISVFGYTNASWTLKADLTAEYACRLLNHMDRRGVLAATPRKPDAALGEEPFLDFSSGYVQRAMADFPKQGSKRPWKLYQNYVLDLVTLRYGRVDDGTLAFSGKAAGVRAA